MLDWTTCPAVERDPAKLSGAWVFRGTRVPVSALFENLEGGATVEQFLDWFPEWGTSYRPSQKRSATSTRSRSEALSRPNGFGETTERGTVKTLSAITSDGCCSPFAAACSRGTAASCRADRPYSQAGTGAAARPETPSSAAA